MAKIQKYRSMRKMVKSSKNMKKMRANKTKKNNKNNNKMKTPESFTKSNKDDIAHNTTIIISNLEKKQKGKPFNINYRHFAQGARVTFM